MSETSKQKRKRTVTTLEEKLEVVDEIEKAVISTGLHELHNILKSTLANI